MKSLRGTAAISGMILFIILGATTFSQILSFSGATEGLVSTILGQGLSALAVVALMMLMLIFLGVFVDQVSMMLITLPVFMPMVTRLGIDPIWFGVLFLICMQLGLLLPPHGLLLMTMRGVAPPEVTMAHIFQAVVPYVVHEPAAAGAAARCSRRSQPGCRTCSLDSDEWARHAWLRLQRLRRSSATIWRRYGARRCFGLLGTANFKIIACAGGGGRRVRLRAPRGQRGQHGRRLRQGDERAHAGQRAFGAGPDQCADRHLRGGQEPHAARGSRRRRPDRGGAEQLLHRAGRAGALGRRRRRAHPHAGDGARAIRCAP